MSISLFLFALKTMHRLRRMKVARITSSSTSRKNLGNLAGTNDAISIIHWLARYNLVMQFTQNVRTYRKLPTGNWFMRNNEKNHFTNSHTMLLLCEMWISECDVVNKFQNSMHQYSTRCWNKKKPKLFQKLPKNSHKSSWLKIYVFKLAQNVALYFGYLCKKIGHKELSKMAQSGHTAQH